MTNTYGTEPHDHEQGHDEILTPEHDAVREAPSDYEFSDEHSATVAEEHNEENGIADSATKTARRSPALPIAAAVGGVLLLAGVAWWQFGGGSASPSVMALSPMANQVARANPVSVPAAPVAQTPDVPVAQTVAAASASAMSSVDAGQTSVATPVAVVAVTPVSQTVASPVNATSDARVDALNKRIEDLQKSLDLITQQLGQVTNMVSASIATAGTPTAKDIQDRLDKLEQQLAAIHQPTPRLAAPVALPKNTQIMADGTVSTPKPVFHHPKLSKPKSSHKSLSAVKPAPSSWVLRAASPGQAWVATSSTSHDLKQVQIGDTLNGIGTVTAITQNDGNWVVQGTKGTIE